MFCKCGKEIPEKRSALGYRKCVECSAERAYTAHMVVHHKTGHTFEIVRDDETAALLKSYERNGFSSSRGSTGSFSSPSGEEEVWEPKEKVILKKTVTVSEEEDAASFEHVMSILSQQEKNIALEEAKSLVKQNKMSSKCFLIFKEIVKQTP
jgi:hypothetical protein